MTSPMNRGDAARLRTRDPAAGDVPAGGRDWMTPEVSSNARRYLDVVLAHWWLVVLLAVLGATGAGLYLDSASKVYTAESKLLVTPLHTTDTTLLGLGLINASVDPTRDAATAVSLVNTPDVARGVQALLGLKRSPASLLEAIKVQAASTSNIVSIQASASNPDLARRLADAFATVVVASRTAHLHAVVAQLLPQVRALARGLPPGDPETAQLVQLELLSVAPDPTLQLATRAQDPSSPSSPRPFLSFAIAIFGGSILGLVGAFALHAVDPRLRGEDALRERYRLPVLARVPAGAAGAAGGARIDFVGDRLMAVKQESFRSLVMNVARSEPVTGGRTLVVSGASDGDGATTTAINIAQALVMAGHRVLLVDANLLHPAIGPMLGITPKYGLEEVASGKVALREALVRDMHGVLLLLPTQTTPFVRDMLSPDEVQRILGHAALLADWIVVDAPPVTLAFDSLPFVQLADHVVLVVRRNHTNLRDLERLTEALAEREIEPLGFVVVDAR